MRHLTEEHKRKIGEKTRINNLRLGLVPPSRRGTKHSAECSECHKATDNYGYKARLTNKIWQ
jgi:hypothetical protein